jgi:hypothetical protein
MRFTYKGHRYILHTRLSFDYSSRSFSIPCDRTTLYAGICSDSKNLISFTKAYSAWDYLQMTISEMTVRETPLAATIEAIELIVVLAIRTNLV